MRLGSLVVTVGLVAATAASAQTPPDAVYRFYNRETGTHFYTVSVSRARQRHPGVSAVRLRGRASLRRLAQARAGAVPVFRFYNTKTGTHFYTTSASERDGIIAYYPQFAYEGAAFYAMPRATAATAASAVFRFYNKNTGAHFYTASAAERDKVVASYPAFHLRGRSRSTSIRPRAAAVAPVVMRSSDAWRFLPADLVRPHASNAGARAASSALPAISRSSSRSRRAAIRTASTTTCRSTSRRPARSARRAAAPRTSAPATS